MIRVSIWMYFYFRKNKINVVMSHNGGWPGGELNRWSLWSGYMARIDYIFLIIHNLPWDPPSYLKPFDFLRNRLIEKITSKIITVSNACSQSLYKKSNFAHYPYVIHNGISSSIKPIDCKNSYKSVVSIVFAGQLHKRKGVEYLIKSMNYVKTSCELIIAGRGDSDYEKYLKILAKESRHQISFLGYVKDMNKIYQYADIAVLPSIEYESFGMTLIEAMSFGIPVVCSNFGGMVEVVEDGVSGYVVTPRSDKDLGNKLEILCKDSIKRKKFGRMAKLAVATKFSDKTMVCKYRKLYKDCK